MSEAMLKQSANSDAYPCVPDLTVGVLRDVVGGRLCHADEPAFDRDDTAVGRIVRDARAIEPGDVFWAFERNADSHGATEYAYEALMRGAGGVVTERVVEPWSGRWSLTVPDTTLALMTLAMWNRARFTGRTIAITGSVGKSTTLRMIEAILRTRLTGVAQEAGVGGHESGVGGRGSGVRENLVSGVLGLDALDDFALFEAAGQSAAAVSELANVCRPEIGVITNLADAQFGTFTDRLASAEAHGKLLAELPAGGVAVLPGDDLWVRRFVARSRARIVWFGRGGDCDVCATDVECRGEVLRFTVDGVRMSVPVWGRHYLGCTLAAYAVGRLMNFEPDEIADALAEFRPLPNCCNVVGVRGRRRGQGSGVGIGVGGQGSGVREEFGVAVRIGDFSRSVTVIDDSRGGTPAAARAALQLLRDFDAPGRRVAVLGDLNDREESLAADYGQLGNDVVSLCGADLLVACGDHADDIVAGAVAAGMPACHALTVRHASEAADVLAKDLAPGDVLLVNGRARFSITELLNQLDAPTQLRAA